ncbi:hypothetical protein ACIQZO_09300 [Streptomyces sp. NPDC097617]|uniref:hypothetical protein n=1 Tax=Streptomyces sp. NPDC097617 TaxID=3366091 RepID=UPI0037FA6110
MECVIYDKGSGRAELVECELPDDTCQRVPERLRGLDDDQFAWVRLAEPSEEELVQLAEVLGLHPPAVEDAVHAHQRPQRERFADVLAVALKTLWYVEEETAVTGEIMLFPQGCGPYSARRTQPARGPGLLDLARRPHRRC